MTINYRVRVSARARSVRLTLSPRSGLTVVVPRNCGLQQIPGIVERKKTWITRHLERFEQLPKAGTQVSADAMPGVVTLPALGQEWGIEYRPSAARSVAVRREGENRIVASGAVGNVEACRAALKRWLAGHAREQLAPWLVQVSKESGLEFSRASVRGQRTRWASCSRAKSISLNYKLLFLPRHLVAYILLHELCHTRHMDHSRRFWALVTAFEPGYKAMDRELRKAWQLVPAWVEKEYPAIE